MTTVNNDTQLVPQWLQGAPNQKLKSSHLSTKHFTKSFVEHPCYVWNKEPDADQGETESESFIQSNFKARYQMSAVQKGYPENCRNGKQINQNQGIKIAKVPNRARQSRNSKTKGSHTVSLDIKAYTKSATK